MDMACLSIVVVVAFPRVLKLTGSCYIGGSVSFTLFLLNCVL